MRNTTIVTLLLAATLALTGCGSSDNSSEPDKPAKATVTVTATPKLSREETKLQCTDAISEAAPGWEDWNYSPGEWADDPRTPDVCQGLVDEDDPTQGNRDFLQALLDGLDAADDPRAEQ
ncbi:hypothetical protein ACFU96_21710 [Streptomyces sp. NPDC057620]|uniref:hypothetical protein n=1 Tax=Streptomyces sp. NPDC057620 TaxID=3346185 RepID=UPI0036B2D44E